MAVLYRSLLPDEMEQWFDHCMYVFNGGSYSKDYRQYFMNHWYNDPWRDLSSIFVAADGDRIVSTVRVFYRKIYFKDGIVNMGGIGEVSTKKEYRGQGISSNLLKMALERMKEKGINVSMLGTGVPNHYAKLGWKNCTQFFCKSFKIKKDADKLNVRQADYSKDKDFIKKTYEEYSQKLYGPLVRYDDFYWDHWFTTESKKVFIVERGEKPLAYAVIVENKDNVYIKEYGESDESDVFDDSIQNMLNYLGLKKDYIVYPLAIKSKMPGKIEEKNGGMIRLVNPFTIGGKTIDKTENLIKLLQENKMSYCFWDTDDF